MHFKCKTNAHVYDNLLEVVYKLSLKDQELMIDSLLRVKNIQMIIIKASLLAYNFFVQQKPIMNGITFAPNENIKRKFRFEAPIVSIKLI